MTAQDTDLQKSSWLLGSLGLLAVSATGGALLEYGIRARQYPAIGSTANATAGSLEEKPAGQGRVLTGENVARTRKSG